MTTEDLIERLLEEGTSSYKKLYKDTAIGRALTRKQEVSIDGVTFSCWREYAVYKTAEYLATLVPPKQVEATLDGNDSTLSVTCSDEEAREISRKIYVFLSKEKLI